MISLPKAHSLGRVIVLALCALATSRVASSQPLAPGPHEIAPAVRERLEQEATNPRIPAWQRECMLRLARGESTRSSDATATAPKTALGRNRASTTGGGAWSTWWLAFDRGTARFTIRCATAWWCLAERLRTGTDPYTQMTRGHCP